ncbi:MAG: hypothetical protein QGH39_07325 [Candidatus Thermoplasmatota archaeon]|jgi:hypothetical protein|nr:hypothetical protein [Candidatus Thermoplasmatota archaeon]MDP7265356.1 hypothetical protein [Candidatus Thermoplasmatota archaeon]
MTMENEIECKYSGSVLELAKTVRFNPATEEYEYSCVNCALAWEKRQIFPTHTTLNSVELRIIRK